MASTARPPSTIWTVNNERRRFNVRNDTVRVRHEVTIEAVMNVYMQASLIASRRFMEMTSRFRMGMANEVTIDTVDGATRTWTMMCEEDTCTAPSTSVPETMRIVTAATTEGSISTIATSNPPFVDQDNNGNSSTTIATTALAATDASSTVATAAAADPYPVTSYFLTSYDNHQASTAVATSGTTAVATTTTDTATNPTQVPTAAAATYYPSYVSSTPVTTTATQAPPVVSMKTKLKRMRDEVEAKFAQHKRSTSSIAASETPVTTTTAAIVAPSLARQASNPFAVSCVAQVGPKPLTMKRSASIIALTSTKAIPSCAICLSSCSVQVRNLCPSRCPGGNVCLTCSNKYWKSWLKDNRFALIPPRCIECRSAIPFDVWRSGVPPSYVQMLFDNFSTPFIVRCPYCDQDSNFSLGYDNCDLAEAAANQVVIEDVITKTNNNSLQMTDELRAALKALNTLYEPKAARRVVDAILNGLGPAVGRAALLPSFFRTADEQISSEDDAAIPNPDPAVMEEVNGLALKMISDPERRCAVQLEFLRRRESRVSTSCCGAPICFPCKYGGDWHDQETCEEVMSRMWEETPEFSSQEMKIFSCPECFVQCVHAGGCSSVRCLCGHEYSLSELDGSSAVGFDWGG